MPKNPWFPYTARRGASAHLICLPHAGAGASTYRAWAVTAPDGLSVCPVQPPGREGRAREQPYRDVRALVRDLAPELIANVPEPFALFGHSTGAMVAFELARELRRTGAPLPRHIFVAGRRAPDLPMPRTPVGGADVTEVREVLRRLGGTPEEVLCNDDLLRHLQPLLAADFHLNEAYEFREEEPLGIPITAYSAEEDDGAGAAEMGPWSRHTSESFTLLTLRGGHFAVFAQAAAVQTHMTRRLGADPPVTDGHATGSSQAGTS